MSQSLPSSVPSSPPHLAPESVTARSFVLGERIDTRAFEVGPVIATGPTVIELSRGFLVVFRYGAAVFIGVPAVDEARLLNQITPATNDRIAHPAAEVSTISLHATDDVDAAGNILLAGLTPERLQVVGEALAKNHLLDYYEKQVGKIFDRIEPLAATLKRTGKWAENTTDLLKLIGDVLLTQHRMVGRVEVAEKPEVLWRFPELDTLYLRLEREFELIERSRALDRKLEVIARTAQTLDDLIQGRRNTRLEIYIVGLFVLDVLLTLYGMIA